MKTHRFAGLLGILAIFGALLGGLTALVLLHSAPRVLTFPATQGAAMAQAQKQPFQTAPASGAELWWKVRREMALLRAVVWVRLKGRDWPAMGMTRGEVESRLSLPLPPPRVTDPDFGADLLEGSVTITTLNGSGAVEVYLLSRHWSVALRYDDTGGVGSSSNRVVRPVAPEFSR
jgi:hypothetical protein